MDTELIVIYYLFLKRKYSVSQIWDMSINDRSKLQFSILEGARKCRIGKKIGIFDYIRLPEKITMFLSKYSGVWIN